MKNVDVPWSLGIALAILLTLALSHLAGGRDAVSVLSGTPPEGAIALYAPLGVLYALAWLGSVLIAPPLLVTGLVGWALKRRSRRRSR